MARCLGKRETAKERESEEQGRESEENEGGSMERGDWNKDR